MVIGSLGKLLISARCIFIINKFVVPKRQKTKKKSCGFRPGLKTASGSWSGSGFGSGPGPGFWAKLMCVALEDNASHIKHFIHPPHLF